MENFSYRERLLLGFGSRRSLENSISLPKSPSRVSDVDFSDVFGGPPRCSMTEIRNSRSGSADSYSPRTEEDKKLSSSSTNPWSTLREKPIFGEESPSRRRLGGDFFDDIFKGDEPLSSTPKRSDRDPFSSVPSSRMQSPVHPSMSRQLSLSKVAKGIERNRSPIKTRDCAFSPIGIPSSPYGSRVGTQTIQWQDDAMFGPPTPNCQSPLSIHFSPRSDGTPKAIDSAGQNTEGHCVKGDNNKFHFSIYKWASKGAPLSMTFRSGNRVKSKLGNDIESKVCKSSEPVLQGVNMPYVDEKLSANRSFKSSFDNQNSISSKDFNINEGLAPTEAVKERIYDIFTKNIEERGTRAKLDFDESGASLEMNSSKTTEKKDKPKVKRNSFGRQEKLEMIPPAREKEGTLRITKNKSKGNDDTQEVKKQVGKKNTSNHTEASTPSLRDEPIDSEKQIPQNRVNGKVKEFVKIFSQEASTKPTDSNDSPSLNFRKKDVGTSKVDKLSHANSCETLTDTAVLAKETLKQSEQAHSDINFSSYRSNDSPSERIDISTSFSGSIPGGFELTPESFEESNSEDLHVNYIIENLPEDPEEQPQNDHLQEETQSLDAKILKWSKGKEGNIRSQLSTLQYVLGPESGWKPVPLVDIIEGASVRRAYQKALLCLHPDKLQQKGASAHQKYIAKKVFDILQEAWTHFGMLTSA